MGGLEFKSLERGVWRVWRGGHKGGREGNDLDVLIAFVSAFYFSEIFFFFSFSVSLMRFMKDINMSCDILTYFFPRA